MQSLTVALASLACTPADAQPMRRLSSFSTGSMSEQPDQSFNGAQRGVAIYWSVQTGFCPDMGSNAVRH